MTFVLKTSTVLRTLPWLGFGPKDCLWTKGVANIAREDEMKRRNTAETKENKQKVFVVEVTMFEDYTRFQ